MIGRWLGNGELIVESTAYISRFLVLNNYLEMLPCLKQVQGSPADLACADVKFTDIELWRPMKKS